MYQIGRILLSSVGPDDARFDPLDLRLLARTRDGRARPADTVLWAENGSGKTVMLKLIYAVLRPDRYAQIGSEEAKSGRLGDFVLAEDVAHVIIEWVPVDATGHVTAGERLLTALVTERTGKSTTNADGRRNPELRTTYYSLRSRDTSIAADPLAEMLPGFSPAEDAGLGIDALPIAADGRRVRATRYLEAVREMSRTANEQAPGSVDLKTFTVQRDWLAHLGAVGLDPALFAFHVQMSRDEAGVSKTFKFGSDLAFVELLLDLVTEPEALELLGQRLAQLAEKADKLPQREEELAFTTGLVARLEPLVRSLDDETRTAAHLATARDDTLDLRDRLAATATALGDLAAGQRDEAGRQDAAARGVRARADRAFDLGRELRRVAADRALTEAEDDLARLTREHAAATQETKAWRLTDSLEEMRRLNDQQQELRDAVEAADRDATPLRAERDEAGRALRAWLAAAALVQRATATAHTDTAHEAEERRAEQDQLARNAADRAARANTERRLLRERLEKFDRQLAHLVANQVLHANEDVAHGHHRWSDLDGRLREELMLAREQRTSFETELVQLEGRRAEVRDDLSARRPQLTADRRDLDTTRAERQRLATHPRVLAVAGLDLGAPDPASDAGSTAVPTSEVATADLEAIGSAVNDALLDAAGTTGRDIVAREVRGAQDRRAAAQLAEPEGLLPAALELDRAVDVLRAAGIDAWTGWRFLATSVRADRREHVICARPEVVDGVVLRTGDDLPTARRILTDAGLDPAAAIVVASADQLTAAESSPEVHGDRFVVPPAAALFDSDAAALEQTRLAGRIAQLDTDLATLADARRADERLAAELAAHLSGWPAGRLTKFAARVGEDERRIQSLSEELIGLTEKQAGVARQDNALKETERRLADQAQTAGHHASRLGDLLEEAAEVAALPARAEQLVADERGATNEAETADHAAAAATESAKAAISDASEAKSAAQRLEEARSQIPSSGPDAPAPADGTAAQAHLRAAPSRSSLHTRWHELDQLVTARTTGSDVAAKEKAVSARLAETEQALPDPSAPERVRGTALLDTPAGLDRISRAHATTRAHEQEIRLASLIGLAQGVAAAAKETVAATQPADRPRWAQLPAELDEATLTRADAERHAADHEATAADLQRQRTTAENAAVLAATAAAAAEQEAALTSQRVTLLTNALQAVDQDIRAADSAGRTFDGDAEAAVTATQRHLSSARIAHTVATDAQRAALDDLQSYTRKDEFDRKGLDLQLRRRIMTGNRESLTTGAAEMLARGRALEGQLRAEIEQMDTHRQLVVTTLAALTDGALSDLKAAQRASRLPSGLGQWSDQPFLRISFTRPDPGELAPKLEVLVNRLLRRRDRPGGAKLLREAIDTCLTSPLKVTIIKPHESMRLTYVGISELGELSGGMRATAAIATFCTLANLRARNSAKSRAASRLGARMGTLFLDNPLGSSNAVYLVHLQRLVAARAGVQLVFTTCIDSPGALDLFTNKLRLFNRGALRDTRSYVRIDETLSRMLATRLDAGPLIDPAGITAVRYVRVAETAVEPVAAPDGKPALEAS